MITRKRPSGAAARRAANREQMQTAILDTARTILTDSGIDALTIRAVAQALDYSPGAIYDYFASKEEILHHLFFAGASGLAGQMESAVAALPPGASAVEAIIAMGWGYRAYALANPEFYWLVFGGLKGTPSPPAVDEAEEEAGGFGTLVRLTRRGVAEGSMVDLPVPLIAHALWAAIHGFVSLELPGHITGADAPGMAIASPEAGLEQRDQFFEGVLRMMLVGLVTDQYRATMPTLGPAPVPLAVDPTMND